MSDKPKPFEATCECLECERTFSTEADEDGNIGFSGIKRHGRTHHQDGRWDYQIVERPSGKP